MRKRNADGELSLAFREECAIRIAECLGEDFERMKTDIRQQYRAAAEAVIELCERE